MRTAIDRSAYSERAKYWDCFKTDRTDEIDFWARLARLYGNRVLAPMCATGETAVGLARLGFEVVAIDLCPEMIEFCKARGIGISSFSCVQADITDLHLEQLDFDFIYLGACDYQRLNDPEDQALALDTLHQLLRPGGCIAIEMMAYRPGIRSNDPHEFEPWRPPSNSTKLKMISWSNFEEERKINRIYRKLQIIDGDEEKEVFYEVPLQMLTRVEIKSLLAQQGFHRIGEYGDYDCSIFTHQSPKWIVHAERKSGC